MCRCVAASNTFRFFFYRFFLLSNKNKKNNNSRFLSTEKAAQKIRSGCRFKLFSWRNRAQNYTQQQKVICRRSETCFTTTSALASNVFSNYIFLRGFWVSLIIFLWWFGCGFTRARLYHKANLIHEQDVKKLFVLRSKNQFGRTSDLSEAEYLVEINFWCCLFN